MQFEGIFLGLALYEVFFNAEAHVSFACEMDTIRLFTHDDYANYNQSSEVILFHYSYYSEMESLAVIRRSGISVTTIYKEKIVFDNNNDVWLKDISYNDRGRYVLGTSITMEELKSLNLTVLVPPKIDCRPMIVRTGNALTATLPQSGCGEPSLTLRWLDNGLFSSLVQNRDILCRSSGVYFSCIEGPALGCAKNFKQYCTNYTISIKETDSEDKENVDPFLSNLSSVNFLVVTSFNVPIAIIMFNSCLYSSVYVYCMLFETLGTRTIQVAPYFDDVCCNGSHAEKQKQTDEKSTPMRNVIHWSQILIIIIFVMSLTNVALSVVQCSRHRTKSYKDSDVLLQSVQL